MTCFIYLLKLVLLFVSIEESIAFFGQRQYMNGQNDNVLDAVAWTNGSTVFWGLGVNEYSSSGIHFLYLHDFGSQYMQKIADLPTNQYGRVKGATAVSYQGSQYIFGGRDPLGGCSNADSNNIWMLPPFGTNWLVDGQVSAGKWGHRAYQMAVVFTPSFISWVSPQQYILLIGGTRCNVGEFNDVWMFSGSGFGDSSSWQKSAWVQGQFGPRAAAGIATILQGSVVIIAGGVGNNIVYNDVWQSVYLSESPVSERLYWKQVCSSAPWSPRTANLVSTTNDYLYLISGASWGMGPSNDVWTSPDGGYTWLALAVADSFYARKGASLVAVGRLLLLIGGGGDPGWAVDVWKGWGV